MDQHYFLQPHLSPCTLSVQYSISVYHQERRGENVKNTECNIIYVAITVYALAPSEVAAEGSSVGCRDGDES